MPFWMKNSRELCTGRQYSPLCFGPDEPSLSSSYPFPGECAAGQDLCYLAWSTLMSYLRMATHPRFFSPPLSPSEALKNIFGLLSLPHVRTLAEAEGFFEVYRDVTGTIPVRGNLVPDAHLVALLRQYDITLLYSTDTDFRKFTCLTVKNPLVKSSK